MALHYFAVNKKQRGSNGDGFDYLTRISHGKKAFLSVPDWVAPWADLKAVPPRSGAALVA